MERLPHGLDTSLAPSSADGHDLSGGQWQRSALARAFHRDAALLVLDEPTSVLDSRAESALFTTMRQIAADRATVQGHPPPHQHPPRRPHHRPPPRPRRRTGHLHRTHRPEGRTPPRTPHPPGRQPARRPRPGHAVTDPLRHDSGLFFAGHTRPPVARCTDRRR
ncbi:ATP-binding cassette domain-containing protein [Streptomyces uncialis]|uniref:ATP-binding cassette domain-containing protein n=1 Tax=Streptomyces uncialis TaxID=1048205 RepID=UPI0037F625EF